MPLLDGADPFGEDLLGASRAWSRGGRFPIPWSLIGESQFRHAAACACSSRRSSRRGWSATSSSRPARCLCESSRSSSVATTSRTTSPGRLWVSGERRRARTGLRRGARRPRRAEGRRRARAPAPSPLLLYGYGSYEISIDPSFSSLRLSLLDRGVIFADRPRSRRRRDGPLVVRDGPLGAKADDLQRLRRGRARPRSTRGWTTPDQLAIRGGSAGGLLMGAVIE